MLYMLLNGDLVPAFQEAATIEAKLRIFSERMVIYIGRGRYLHRFTQNKSSYNTLMSNGRRPKTREESFYVARNIQKLYGVAIAPNLSNCHDYEELLIRFLSLIGNTVSVFQKPQRHKPFVNSIAPYIDDFRQFFCHNSVTLS